MNRLIIYLIASGCFLVGVAELIVAGILHIIAADMRISIALAGQLITAYSLAFAIGTPVLVAVFSRLPVKKLLIGALALFIVGCFVSWGSGAHFPAMLLSRIVLGVSAGVFCVVALGSVAKLVPPDKIGSAVSTVALAFGLAMTLGVPIGIAISGWWGWQTIFAVLGAVSLLVMLGLIRWLPPIEGDAQVSFRRQFIVLKNPVILSGLLFSLITCLSQSVILSYLTPILNTVLHLEVSRIGIVMFVLGIFGMLGSRAGGYSVDTWGPVKTISLGTAASIISLALLPLFSASLAMGLVWIVLWMISLFMTAPAIQTYFIQEAPQSANLVLSLNTSVIHLGLAGGAAFGGLLVTVTSTVLYNPWVASGCYFASLLVAVFSFAARKRYARNMMEPS
ncbi:MFS transporter [Paenibacillus thalictri]|uniref:MFS transporter n=1 Tax=Paenibacillus thalictri TaxID=2527873 RepID=A0A4Q9DVM4_9BACL|nr:MFS transporter [Paenibacillus thalictri]TBL81097.1 MFS transporter [Paenibacillus thalictri]